MGCWETPAEAVWGVLASARAGETRRHSWEREGSEWPEGLDSALVFSRHDEP